MAGIIKKIIFISLSVIAGTVLFISCSGTRPSLVAKGHGSLAPCPETPNCVSTLSKDDTHTIEPLKYDTDMKTAMTKLVNVINSMKRTKIVAQTENYLYAEFTSGLWRFVDDVEFSFDADNSTIHFRSASRLGKSDFGVNRARMEEIRKRFNELKK